MLGQQSFNYTTSIYISTAYKSGEWSKEFPPLLLTDAADGERYQIDRIHVFQIV